MNQPAAAVRLAMLAIACCFATAASYGEVSYERLLADEANGADWLSYSGGYRAERFAPMDQINRDNVSDLRVIWAYQMQPTGVRVRPWWRQRPSLRTTSCTSRNHRTA